MGYCDVDDRGTGMMLISDYFVLPASANAT